VDSLESEYIYGRIYNPDRFFFNLILLFTPPRDPICGFMPLAGVTGNCTWRELIYNLAERLNADHAKRIVF
jgi:hypothetical protein